MKMSNIRALIVMVGAFCFALPAAAMAHPFTPRDLVTLDRLTDPQISRDGNLILYDVRTTDLAANRGRHSLWLLNPAHPGVSNRRLAISDKGATNGRWSPDGRWIYFLSSRSKSQQVWRADVSGVRATRVTNLPVDVQAFRIAPDGKHLVVGLAVFPDCPSLACTAKRNAEAAARKATGRLYTHIFIRHWDTWDDGTKNHLFALTIGANGAAASPVSLMRAFDGDVPSKPFGDENDFAISPDSRTVVFSARLAGKSEPWSTNFDLYRVPMNGSSGPADITSSNPAWDADPVFSPDGSKLAYRAQKRPGFESDRYGIIVRDWRTGTTREIDPTWDRSPDTIAWSPDGRTIYATANDMQFERLFAINVANGSVKRLTQTGDIESFDVGKNAIVFGRASQASPAQIFGFIPGSAPEQLTDGNDAKLRDVALSKPVSFHFKGWNDDTVYGWVTKPYGYVPGKKYPVAFLIHGGPQGSWLDGWSYRWNVQTYAGHGYAVVQIDPHASTGYGQAFVDAVSQHWGDRPLEDLQKGWSAALDQFSFLDGNRACALGASYGGYMVYWIAGNWNTPWKCLVDHDGVFDNRIMGYATEELWFSEWENGGTPWANPQGYEKFNPVNYVDKWRVPMLVIHSEQDFRIPYDQGIGAFTAMQRRGIPSELLTFPDENHWVLKPQNSLQWHNTVDAWLDRWLK